MRMPATASTAAMASSTIRTAGTATAVVTRVEVLLQRFPDDDINLVVLCNMEGLAGEVRDAVVGAWRRPDHRSSCPRLVHR